MEQMCSRTCQSSSDTRVSCVLVQYEVELRRLQDICPAGLDCQLESVGTTWEGRDMWRFEVSGFEIEDKAKLCFRRTSMNCSSILLMQWTFRQTFRSVQQKYTRTYKDLGQFLS